MPPPQALVQNNLPRPGYQKRYVDSLDMDMALNERNATDNTRQEQIAEYRLDELKKNYLTPPKLSSIPRACLAEPTAADTDSPPVVTSTAPMVGGGLQSALNSFARPTAASEES